MKNKKLGLLCAGALALGLVGCGDDDDDNDTETEAKLLTLTGVLASHPLNNVAALATSTTVTMADLAIAVINPPSVQPLATALIDNASCTAAGCALSIEGVDGAGVSLGLAFVVDNASTSSANAFVKTGSGAAAKKTVEDAMSALAAGTGDGTIADLKGFVLTQAAAGVVAGMTLNTAADTIANGFMVGMVLDAAQAPVAGATVTSSNANLVAVYPNDDFSGVGEVTGAHGMFFAVSSVGGTQVSLWNVAGPAGGTNTWPVDRPAGTSVGSGYVLMMTAEP